MISHSAKDKSIKLYYSTLPIREGVKKHIKIHIYIYIYTYIHTYILIYIYTYTETLITDIPVDSDIFQQPFVTTSVIHQNSLIIINH